MIALFLLLIIVAIALGIVGVVAKGLLHLLIIGIVVFLGALVLGADRRGVDRQAAGQVALGSAAVPGAARHPCHAATPPLRRIVQPEGGPARSGRQASSGARMASRRA
jgi:hypothetical protein